VNTQSSEFTIHRVLVALDASAHSMAALEMAAGLAAVAKAELVGLFVEDTQLLHLAESPHAREMLYPSAQQQPLNLATMEQRLRAQAEQARCAMAELADPAQVRWSFQVVRGEVNAAVLAAASETDVLALGRTGWSLARPARLGSTALAAAHNLPRVLLLVQRCLPFERQVLAVVNGTESLQPTLMVAARLAQVCGNKLIVLTSSTRTSIAEEGSDEGSALLKEKLEHLQVRFRRIPGTDSLSIAHAVQTEGGGILAIGASVCSMETVKQLFHHLETPIFMIR
jgi:nucleotide-binding universal stress UspA family protein